MVSQQVQQPASISTPPPTSKNLKSLMFIAMDEDVALFTGTTINHHWSNGHYTEESIFRHDRQRFIIDSGATTAVTPHHQALTHMCALHTQVLVANGTTVTTTHVGQMGDISQVRLMTSAPVTVLPISTLTSLGYDVMFTLSSIELINRLSQRRTLFASRRDGVMTVMVDEFHGIHFQAQDDEDIDYSDLPELIAISDDESDDGPDDIQRD